MKAYLAVYSADFVKITTTNNKISVDTGSIRNWLIFSAHNNYEADGIANEKLKAWAERSKDQFQKLYSDYNRNLNVVVFELNSGDMHSISSIITNL